ncbi:hypothetical protein [Nonlabens sp.]|uniref:hypothetical protein n=1 Tax=Nonlabens sp. TaxID=1888209 RepID=UPI001BCD3784
MARIATNSQSIFIGCIAALTSNLAIYKYATTGMHNTLDVFPSNGVVGIIGKILTAVFAKEVRLVYGETETFMWHMITLVAIAIVTFRSSFIFYKILDICIPIRVTFDQKEWGLGISQQGIVMDSSPVYILLKAISV